MAAASHRLAGRGLILVALLATAADLPGQDDSPRVGTRVVTKYQTPLRAGPRVVDDDRTFRVYTVERADGGWLWLASGSVRGWAPAAQVVPFDRAIDFYTREVRANPANAAAYNKRGLVWQEKGEPDRALADYTEAIRLDPNNAAAFNNRGWLRATRREYDRAIADYTEAIRLDPNQPTPLSSRAWLWATCPEAKYRDGQRAVASATRACELSEWADAYNLDTLAAAYAEAGDFPKAVAYQGKANALFPSEEGRTKGRVRLALYKEGKPYREGPSP